MISVIIPVYQCAGCLTELHARLKNNLAKITADYEIIYVDDCSKDQAWEVISKLAKDDTAIKAIKLSRNFGQHLAITAGLSQSRGDWVVVMDCDLQDPPEFIGNLYDKAQEGYDLVFTRRKGKKHSLLRRTLSRYYFKLLTMMTDHCFNPELGSFTIISRKVVDSYLQFKDHDRHYLFILYWMGFKAGYLDYSHTERFCGKSSYSFRTLLKHALRGVLFQTSIPLKLIVSIGFFISALSFCFALYTFFRYCFYSAMPGWSSLAILISFVGGVTISCMGLVGLYVARIFEQVKGRPMFIIHEKIN